jgi:predicted AAA+ superfamily ATPase
MFEQNHWWAEKAVKTRLVPPLRREMFEEIKRDLNRRQIQILTGLRRVGKSTIFYQLIDQLIKEGVNPVHIIYCSFDEPEFQGKRLQELLKEYSRLTGVNYKDERVYLFLDEVQKSKNWVADVKLLYDGLPHLKILVSGSASLNILAEAKRTLAGRAIYYELPPLSFEEFLRFREISFEKERLELYKDVLSREFERFLSRPFPELVNEEDASFIRRYIRETVIEPVLLKDIPREFGPVDTFLLEDLVNLFLSNPGQYLSVDALARELRRTKTTIYKALFYLEFSFLIRRILNYRPSIRATSRKLSRVYAYHPSLTIPFQVSEQKFVENLVMFELRAKHYWRQGEKEIDFLKELIPVEVKFGSKIEERDLRHMIYFMRKYQVPRGFVITKETEGELKGIHLIPLWKFCLVGLPS